MNDDADPLDPDRLEAARQFATGALEAAGRDVLRHFRAGVDADDKSAPAADFDPVTVADREAETRIRAAIAARWPTHAILGEEAGTTVPEGADPRCGWTVDPIDGTRGFLCGFAHWGMLLAHTVDGRPRVGAVRQPWIGESFSATPDGAWYRRDGDDERALRVRPCGELSSVRLATTDPHLFVGDEAELFDRLRRSVRLVRYGADCYAYCLLAGGHLDLVVESGLGPWDIQALMPVVEAAGGVITDWRGEDCSGGGRVVAAGDARVHEAALEQLARAGAG